MKGKRAAKYRKEVVKVNTGMNRKRRALAEISLERDNYRHALETIRDENIDAETCAGIADKVLAKAKKKRKKSKCYSLGHDWEPVDREKNILIWMSSTAFCRRCPASKKNPNQGSDTGETIRFNQFEGIGK